MFKLVIPLLKSVSSLSTTLEEFLTATTAPSTGLACILSGALAQSVELRGMSH